MGSPVRTAFVSPERRAPRTRRVPRRTARHRARPVHGTQDAVIAYLHRETRVSSPRTRQTASKGIRSAPLAASTGDSGRESLDRTPVGTNLARAPATSCPRGTADRARNRSRELGSGAGKSRVARHRRSGINGRTSASSSADVAMATAGGVIHALPPPARGKGLSPPSAPIAGIHTPIHDGPRRSPTAEKKWQRRWIRYATQGFDLKGTSRGEE